MEEHRRGKGKFAYKCRDKTELMPAIVDFFARRQILALDIVDYS